MVLQVSSTGGEHSRCANETPKSLNKLTANNDNFPALLSQPKRFFDFAHLQVADLTAKTVAIVGDGFRGAPRGMGFPIYVAA